MGARAAPNGEKPTAKGATSPCRNPACAIPVANASDHGPARLYCSDRCRMRAHRHRQAEDRRLAGMEPGPVADGEATHADILALLDQIDRTRTRIMSLIRHDLDDESKHGLSRVLADVDRVRKARKQRYGDPET